MLWVAHHGLFRLVVSAVHLEVMLFVAVCTFTCGWDIGASLYLLAVSSLVYFCPFHRKYIPYIFSVAELCCFVGLLLAGVLVPPYYSDIPAEARIGIYIFNSLACFWLVLFASFSAKVSATVSRKELQDENKNLSVLANYDYLTGLLSRRAFLAILQECAREPISLAMGDIDDFKKINDTYGHDCGDYILQTGAELMRAQCGEQVEICRWGGEEFVLLFRGMPREKAESMTEVLRQAVEGYSFLYRGQRIRVTMTFGLSMGEGKGSGELIESADRRMYRGKQRGKNCVIAR